MASKHTCHKNKTVIRQGKLLTGCDVCLPAQMSQGDSAASHRRFQQQHYRREMTQPNQGRAFAKAYPQKARELYGDAAFRELS